MNRNVSWEKLLLIFSADFLGHLIRYVVIAGAAFLLLYVWRHRRLLALKIQAEFPPGSDLRREFGYSVLSLAVFGLVGVGEFLMYRAGWTQLYTDLASRGWGYFWFSTLLLIFAHDTYFYWTHRLMHWKPLFPLVHAVHHRSHNPTPWAAFAFHPLEAVIEAGIFPLFSLLVPVHPLAALVWLLYMTGMNVLGHCGFELLPRGFTRHPLFRWHNTSVHHNQHHHYVHCNYGLYYNFWDRWLGTNHARYHEEFERVKAQAEAVRPTGTQGPGR